MLRLDAHAPGLIRESEGIEQEAGAPLRHGSEVGGGDVLCQLCMGAALSTAKTLDDTHGMQVWLDT